MTQKRIRITSFAAMGVILAVILAANILAGIFSNVITVFLYGYGVNFDNLSAIEGDELCQEIAAEGIVMLENNGLLPLKNVTNINVFGWGATDGGFIISGSGSGSAQERGGGAKKLFLEGITDAGFKYNEDIINLCVNFQKERQGASLYDPASTFFRLYEPSISAYEALLPGAKSFSDTALVVVSRLGGEGKDLPKVQYKSNGSGGFVTDSKRHYLKLSSEEENLIDLVANNFNKVVVIINACNVMELGFLANPKIDAAISSGGVGQSGAVAIGKILNGEVTPSGKTVDTYLYDLTSDPSYVNSGEEGVVTYKTGAAAGNVNKYIDYAEDIYVGYRYFETAAKEGAIAYDSIVQYPFGYGLSYTEFKWSVKDVKPANGVLTKDSKIEITVDVENTGNDAGQDVVQVYYTLPYDGKIEKPYIQLGAFAKTIVLAPGAFQTLTLSFDAYDMASYDCYDLNGNGFKGWELDAGKYGIRLHTDVHTVKNCEKAITDFTIASGIRYSEDPVTGHEVKNLFTGSEAVEEISIDGSNSGAGINFLSRKDFGGTFPSSRKAARDKASVIVNQGNYWGYNKVLTNVMPQQGVAGDLSLMVLKDGKPVLNEELILELGGDYDSQLWESLLKQITREELIGLVQLGGYRTAKIDSIGKVECVDLDGPSGLNSNNMSSAETFWTCFPVETVLACTWNSTLSYIYGLAIGKEAADTNVSGWYAPAVNLHRNAFEGRNFEYYSEDPYLSGLMGAETTRGALANGLYCYVKHFAVNETETERRQLYTWLTEQALREIYLRPFEICVKKGGANGIMTSHNRLGATWTGGSYPLLTTVLRNEWGFRGSVVTDYYAQTGSFMNVDQGLRAGGDLWLTGGMLAPDGPWDTTSPTAVFVLRQAAKNILYTYTNTYHTAYNHDSSQDRFVADVGLKELKGVFPWWVFGVAAIDLAVIGGIVVWIYFLEIKPKRKKRDNPV